MTATMVCDDMNVEEEGGSSFANRHEHHSKALFNRETTDGNRQVDVVNGNLSSSLVNSRGKNPHISKLNENVDVHPATTGATTSNRRLPAISPRRQSQNEDFLFRYSAEDQNGAAAIAVAKSSDETMMANTTVTTSMTMHLGTANKLTSGEYIHGTTKRHRDDENNNGECDDENSNSSPTSPNTITMTPPHNNKMRRVTWDVNVPPIPGSPPPSPTVSSTLSNPSSSNDSVDLIPPMSITSQYSNILMDIQHGLTVQERCDAVHRACDIFNHGMERAHNYEIQIGADTVLFKHLTFLLYKRNFGALPKQEKREDTSSSIMNSCSTASSPMNEICATLSGFETILRCSTKFISISFDRVGHELLSLLITFMEEELELTTRTWSSDTIFKISTKIIGHFARVGSLSRALANTPGLLTILQRIIADGSCTRTRTNDDDDERNRDGKSNNIPIEAGLTSLWVIANLACKPENMIPMAEHPHLLDTIVDIASHPKKEDNISISDIRGMIVKNISTGEMIKKHLQTLSSRSIAIRAILNLSWADANKVYFAQHASLVNVLLRATFACHLKRRREITVRRVKGGPSVVQSCLVKTRRHATSALRNVAAVPSVAIKVMLCTRLLCRDQHQPQHQQTNFLKTLADIAACCENDEIVKENIFATMFHLVSVDTAKMFAEQPPVLEIIVKTAIDGGRRRDHGCNNGEIGTGNPKNARAGARAMALRTIQTLQKISSKDDIHILKPFLHRLDSQMSNNCKESVQAPSTSTCVSSGPRQIAST